MRTPRLSRRTPLLALPLALGVALTGSCSDSSESVASGVEFPLFTELDEAAFDASCAAFRVEQSKAGGKLFTKAPAEIDWAEDIYAAIERATAEDKPIFLQTHCKENGDPSCDV